MLGIPYPPNKNFVWCVPPLVAEVQTLTWTNFIIGIIAIVAFSSMLIIVYMATSAGV
jgi:hypothetical protein